MNQNDNQENNNQENNNQEPIRVKKNGIKTNILRAVKAITTIASPVLPLVIVIVLLGITVFDFSVEIFTSQDTTNYIIENLEIENLKEMVEIKEDGQGGYYLDFVDNFDEKIEEINKKMSETTGVHNLPKSSEMLKKIIKAELVTQYPDLGGVVPEGSDGFQGAVKIRRATPDKEIEEMKNTGVEDSIPLVESDILDPGGVGRYEEIVKSWSAGQKLTIRARATIYEQEESEINPGSDTGYWKEVLDDTGRVRTIAKGTQVEYTGTYKNNTNLASGNIITYVEIKYEGENVYVRANYLSDNSGSSEDAEEASIKSNFTVSSRDDADREKKTEIGGEKDEYVVAIAAGRNNTDDKGAISGELVEEDLTIEVAEKVQELIEERFSNVKVVQTGSTSSNRGGVKPEERAQLTREANPDLCIQIYFNSSSSETDNGVEVIYKEGDGISLQLAEILSETISEEMGLENKQAGTDVDRTGGNLVIIENAATTDFPSVVTQGGYITGNKDAEIIKDGGVDKYAEGIVKGIQKYLQSLHDGYTSTETEEETLTEGISSVVRNLKYVPLETIEQYIEEGNLEALEVFSLDEDNNLITATWSSTDGVLTLRKNAPINLETALQKYIMPYEYLLFFYIDTNDEEFSIDLADTVINDTEIVIALQDNVTTTQTTTTVQEERIDDNSENEYVRDISSSTSVTETCSTAIDITYVKTWFMKSYQENSYSEEVLNLGDEESKIVTIKGQVSETTNNSTTGWELVTSGVSEDAQDYYSIYRRDSIDTWRISNQYESGDLTTEGNESTFVKLYNEHKMDRKVRPDYLFIMLAENERTANMVDLTKYLIFKATNVNYGVIEFDFTAFQISSLTPSGGSDYIVDTTQSPEEIVIKDLETLKLAFSWYPSDQVLQEYAEYFLQFQEEYNVNAVFAAAVAITESSAGTNIQIGGNNMFSISAGGQGNWNSYHTMEESIEAFFKLISREYFTNNQNTVDSIARGNPEGSHMYCVPPDDWIKNTCNYMTEMFRTAGIDVSSFIGGGGDIVAIAKQCHDYVRLNGFTYLQNYLHNTIPIDESGYKTIDCSSFVTWVLYEYGYTDLGGYQQSTSTLLGLANSKGWTVKPGSQAQAGDIVLNPGVHTAIYAGNGQFYDCGSTSLIQQEINTYNPGYAYAITVPKP